MALKNTAIDKYHYYNYLKNWKGTTGDLVRFLYGYTVEGIEYPFPAIDGLSQEDYNNLKDAWKNLRNGIKAIRDKIDKRQDGYFDFWHSNRIFSVEDPTKIIRDIRDVLTLFKDSLKEIDNNVQNVSQNCIRSILENMAKKEQSEQSQNKDFQSYTEVIFVDAKGQALSDRSGEDGLKNYLYSIKQVTSSHKVDVGGLIKSQCPPEIRSYAKQVARKLISNTRLRIISEQANVYGHNVIIGKEADFSDGEVNMERIVDNYATILKGNAESVPFYDSYHIKPLPKISILIVTDVSGSMEMLNMTLKPFLSVFYLEGLNTLFDINIVDFSESVVKEPKSKMVLPCIIAILQVKEEQILLR